MKNENVKLKKLKQAGIGTILSVVAGLIFNSGKVFANPCAPSMPCNGFLPPSPGPSDFFVDPNGFLSFFLDEMGFFSSVLVFDILVDSFVFLLTILVIKLIMKINLERKVVFMTLPLMVLMGLIADFVGFHFWGAMEGNIDWFYFIFSIFGIIMVADAFLVKKILKMEWKTSILVGISMAIFTHPALWAIIFSIFKG